MENIKDLILFKPNELIGIEGGYVTNINRLAYNYIIHRLQIEGNHYAKINIADFFNDLDLGKNYDELISYLDSLQKIRVVSRDSKGKLWGAFNLLSYFKKFDDGTFHVEIPSIIFESLCNQDKLYYTTIKLLEQKALKYLYTPIFYELFKKYEKINIPNFFIDELKNLTGTQNKYQEYKYFKRDVLLKSIKELNQFDEKYEYSFEEIKLGRKVNEIRFIRIDKNIIDITPEPQISEKLLKVIEKSRKNRFIDETYSQKAMKKLLQKYEEKDIIKALGELYKYNSEIKNFSKILTSKIEDIKNSKMDKIKENQGYTLVQEEVETPLKIDIIEPKKTEEIEPLDKLLEKLPIKISKADYEDLYNEYLKQIGEQHNPYLRKAFDLANLNRFKIKE